MKRSDLQALQKKKSHVEYDGNVFTLHPPSWEAYNELQRVLTRFNKEKDSDQQTDTIMESMVLAIAATMEFEDDPNPVTREEAQAIVFNTGVHDSPIVKGAMEQCGIPWRTRKDAEEEGVDPTEENPFS